MLEDFYVGWEVKTRLGRVESYARWYIGVDLQHEC